jgi:hypothetical protein
MLVAAAVGLGLYACSERTPAGPTTNCTIAISPANVSFGNEGGPGTVAVSTSAGCTWTAAASGGWITIAEGASGTGSGSVKYTVAANTSGQSRTGTLTVGGQAHGITQAGQGACTFNVSPLTPLFGSAGGSGSIAVATTGTCAWTATTTDSWLTILGGASGQGNGAVSYTVAPYTGTTGRTGTIRVAGVDVQITQTPTSSCTFDVSPQSASFGSNGGQGTTTVSAPASCSWTASTSDAWLTIVSGATGQGNGTVTYAAATSSQTAARTGVIHVAGVDVRVTQTGNTSLCEYQVAPVAVSPCMIAMTTTVTVTTAASCPWTAEPNVGWITLSEGQSGLGSGTVSFSVSSNYDAPRQGIVMVRWPTPTLGQNVQVAQAGCHYAVSPDTMSVSAAGGSGTVNVLQESDPNTCGGPLQNGCVWTPVADVSWITITNPGSHQGDDTVRFTVSSNSGTSSRTGTITVKGKVLTITQSGS